MNTEQIIQLFIIVMLLGFSASFSAVETALFSLSKIDLEEIKRSGSLIGKNILTVLSNPRDLLTTILFGNEFINIGVAILSGSLAYSLMEGYDWKITYLVSVGVSTIFILIFGEIIPKTLAWRNSLSVSYLFIGPLRLFAWLTAPFRKSLTWFMDKLLILLGGDPQKTRRMIMEEEFMHLVNIGRKSGTIEEIEHTFIENVFEFDDKKVKEIMTPHHQIKALKSDVSIDEAFAFLKDHQLSRVPVYEDTLDNIQGVIFAKDLIVFKIHNNGQSLKDFLRPAYFIHQEKVLSDVFQRFKKEKVHIALVCQDVFKEETRQSQRIVGLVTMDDLLKELTT